MRPIRLTMSAFGSYSGVEVIDFTKVQGGLFLVTGDTGAGKTTIFDAVTYALYDRTSGGRRDGNMMRSQYAGEETDTYVEYVFSYRGEQYTVRRNPEYMRIGKRKNADGTLRLVKETAKVSLLLPDGREYQGKKREIDRKIEEIIGLDAGQFTQIAMIAQGEFLKLLHAESKERKRIFSRIFQTQIYWKMQEELKEQGKQLYIRLKENETDVQREMNRVDVTGEEETAADRWEELLQMTVPPAEEVLKELRNILGIGMAKASWLEGEEEALQKASEELRTSIEKKQEVNRIFDLLEEAETACIKLEDRQAENRELKKQAGLGERAEYVSTLETQVERTRKELRDTAEKIRKIAAQKEASEAAGQKLREEVGILEKELSRTEPRIQAEIVRLETLLPHYESARRLRRECEAREKELAGCMDMCRRASEDYEEKYRRFFFEQAGILAKELREGVPCPVCGSIHHPVPAQLSETAVDQKAVEEAKEIRERAEKKRAQVQEAYQKVCAGLEAEETILKNGGKTEGDARTHLQALEKELNDKKETLRRNMDALQRCVQENRQRVGQLETLAAQREQLEGRLAEEQEDFSREMRTRFEEQEEYQEAKRWIFGWKEKAEQVKVCEDAMLKARARAETIRKQTEGRKRENTDADREKQEVLTAEIKAVKVQRLEIHGKNAGNRSAYEALERYFGAQKDLRKQYEVVGNLSRTANGNLSGSVKLDFETYVQRKYFRRIIQAANRRLARMTSNGFILQCREIKDLSSQGQAGLDLDAYDLVTDSVRDVKSLSGGESFMAALSMALGLADIVQNTAGAVSLETMFVDEGFGSLDDASRERAIQILKELAGEKGLVGIISHVNELKEQIDWKLAVEKSDRGSHAKWVL